MLVIIFISILTILLLYYILEQQLTKKTRAMVSNIPGPKAYPFVGSVFEFGNDSVELMKRLQKMADEYGSVVSIWMGPIFYVILSDVKDVEVILNSTVHLNKPASYNLLKRWLGTGLVSAPASKWKIQRKILTPAFHFKILETYVDVFNANISIMKSLLKQETGKEKFDILPYIDKCTLDIICETSMATSIDAQLNKESKFTKALQEVSRAIIIRVFTFWLFPEFIFNLSPLGRTYNRNLEYIDNFVNKVIAKKKQELSELKAKSTSQLEDLNPEEYFYGTKKRLVFLDLILMYASDPSIHLSDEDIRDEVNTFMFAGHDTTASALGFAVYMLGSHPDVQDKVLAEVKSVMGDSDRDPTYQDLLSLKYLEQVIKETLRLYPSVPFIGRELHHDLTLPSGYTIPAGTDVTLFFFNVHRDPNVFPDPEKFNPENFLPERSSGRQPFAYTPFSAGPRNCIGQKFGMLEMKTILSSLVRTYKITAVAPEPVLAYEIVLRSATGINVRLEERS